MPAEPLRFLATCARGTEAIVAQELAELGARSCRPGRDKVRFAGTWQEACRVQVEGRTVHKVHLVLGEGQAKGLDDLAALARQVDWGAWLRPGQAFAVRPVRAGSHAFTSLDMGRVVGDEVVRGVRGSRGGDLRVDLTRPEVEVSALLHEDQATLGLNLTGESLHVRGYRAYTHPAPLRPSLAAVLLRWAGYGPATLAAGLWDPMCGSATLPIEAAMVARRIAPNPRRPLAMERIDGIPPEPLQAARQWAEEQALTGPAAPAWEDAPILGTERQERHLLGAAENARAAGVWDAMRLATLDATQALAEDLPFAPRLVVTNPPYGIRISSKRVVLRLYRGLLDRLQALGVERLAVIVGSPFLEDAAKERGLLPSEVVPVRFGDLPSRLLRFDLR